MALVNKAFSVSVTPGAMPPVIHVSEYDISRSYIVTINGENGTTYTIPTGATATIEGTLNNKVGFSESATIDGNTVTFSLTESMTAYSGKAWCKIKLVLNDEPIQTCAFVLAVDRAGVEAETVIGAPGFEEQIQEAVDAYLDEHGTGTVAVDPTLTRAGEAADAKVVGDRFAAFVTVQESLNLYNGEYLYGFRSGSNGAVTEYANFVYSKPIALDAGDYLFPSSEAQMGVNNGRKVWVVNENGEVLSSISGTVVGTKTQTGKYDNRNIIHFTMPSNGYVSMNIGGEYSATGTVNQVNNFMVVQGSTIADFPDYEAYSETEVSLKDDIQLTSAMVAQVEEIVGEQPEAVVVDATLTISGAAADAKVVGDKFAEFITTEQSANLYNGGFAFGYRVNQTEINESNTYVHSTPIALPAGNYLFPSTEAQFSTANGRRVWIVDQSGNASSSIDGTVVGTKTQEGKYSNRNIIHFTMPSDGYVSMNIGVESAVGQTVNQVNNFMVVRGSSISDFPDYEPYTPAETVLKSTIGMTAAMVSQANGLSGLIGKTAIFDGDSICAGTSVGDSEPTRGYGWAGRIGIANEMEWKNFGRDGGVITSASNASVSDKHSVCDNVDTMYAQYPNADFIIFEGGTNDADKAVTIGDVLENDFSGTYDATTFCGALNTIFYKATNYWKGKAIGYIVAHKMGRGANNRTTRATYFTAAKSVCAKWGIPVIDLWDGCYLNPDNPNLWNQSLTKEQNIAQGYLYTDGQHLTAKGYNYISPMIEDWMKGI